MSISKIRTAVHIKVKAELDVACKSQKPSFYNKHCVKIFFQ